VGPSLSTIAVVTALVAATVVAAVAYLRRVRVQRAPVGVYNARDIVVMSVVLVVLPPLYVHLPTVAVVAVMGFVAAFITNFTLTPLLGARPALVVAVAALAADVALAQLHDDRGHHLAYLALNDLLLLVMVVGVVNLYAQSGMRAREVTVFAAGLVVYDFLATVAFPVMVDFFTRVSALPVTPAFGWGRGGDAVAVGLGDVLVAVLWTVTAEKAFGRRAAVVAGVTGVAGILALFLAFWADWLNRAVPAMVVLGPVIVVEYRWFLRRTGGRERSTARYLAEADGTPDPERPARPGAAPADLGAAIRLAEAAGTGGAGRYVAVVDGRPVAEGPTAGSARRAAAAARPGSVPLLVWTEGVVATG
jgi:hypothetical protein